MSITIEKIMQKYPQLYKNGEVRSGFFIGKGWLPLVDILSSIIEEEISNAPEEFKPYLYCTQVKEKWGGLRFYMDHTTPLIDGAVSMAESMSLIICEVCGEPGTLRTGSWWRTLCEKHHELELQGKK